MASPAQDFLSKLPEEILLHIACSLNVHDIFSLKQTCRRMYTWADGDYLWHQLVNEEILIISPRKNVNEIPGAALQVEALRSLRLEANWRRTVPKLKSCHPVQCETLEGSYDAMDILSEGKTLVAIRRLGRGDRPFFTVSVFSLLDAAISYQSARVRVSGTLVHHDVSLLADGNTFALAATILRDDERLVEVRKLPLPGGPVTFMSRNSVHEASFHAGFHTREMFHKVSVQGDTVAATIVSMIEGVPNMFRPLKIIVANWESGVRRIIDSDLPELTNLIDLRLFEFHLMLVLTRNSSLTVLITPLDVCLQVGEDATIPYKHDEIYKPHFLRVDTLLPARSEVYISDSVNIGPYRPSPSLSVLAIPPWPGKGTFLHFEFAIRRTPDDYTLQTLQHSSTFKLWHEGYVELIQLGTNGRRAVWLQQTLESDDVRVNRLDYDPICQRLSSVAVLLPPEPGLPFKPRDCRTLAFDEATGRLCLGLYDGSIYILDYA